MSADLTRDAPPTWQDISTAPKDGTLILVGAWRNGDWGSGLVRWFTYMGHLSGWGMPKQRDGSWYYDALDAQPTHWAPLPAPPDLPSDSK